MSARDRLIIAVCLIGIAIGFVLLACLPAGAEPCQRPYESSAPVVCVGTHEGTRQDAPTTTVPPAEIGTALTVEAPAAPVVASPGVTG